MSIMNSSYANRLPFWVLSGAILGVIAGVLLGESTSILRPIGSTYVMLMQIVVFPYIICSLLHALGSLAPTTALRLFRVSWLVYLALWGITLATIFILSLAITQAPTPSFLDATLTQDKNTLLDLLIPVNPFFDLANNNIPAIVVFSIIYGIAIQRIDNKESFLNFLHIIKTASVTIWQWVVLLAPIAVFALFADSFGTLDLATLANLSMYLIAVLTGTVVLAFWILPAIISSMCPKKTREILLDLRSAFVIAAVTSLSVAALPFIQQAAEKLAKQVNIKDENSTEIISTTLAVSYPLAQLGNFFIWLFVLFAAFYYRAPIGIDDQILLPFVTLLSSFGSPSTSIDAVSFMSNWLTFPPEATGLYVEMMTITRYGQVLASVMGFAFITFLVTLRYYGKLEFHPKRWLTTVLVSFGVLIAVTVGGNNFQKYFIDPQLSNYLTFELAPDVTDGVNAVIEKDDAGAAEQDHDGLTTFRRIQETGELRVGFNPNIIPFSYRNNEDKLVGFDIAYAYQLARDLDVKLRLVPFAWGSLQKDLEARKFDLAASGIYVTNDRLRSLEFSDPYFQSSVALIVRADKVDNYLDRDEISKQPNLTIGIFDDPVLKDMTRRLFPGAAIKVLPNYNALPEHPHIDAALWTLEQAKAWSAQHTNYTAVLPRNLGGEIPIAFLMPSGSDQFRAFVNYWLRLQSLNDFGDRMHEKWLNGKSTQKKVTRPGLLSRLFNRDAAIDK